MIKDVTDLNVYQKSQELLPQLYELLSRLPGSERDLELQLKRSAKSVSANIAEGFGKRNSGKEFKRYLLIALGSNDEVVSHLRTLIIVVPRLSKSAEILLNEYKTLSKQLNSLHKLWRY